MCSHQLVMNGYQFYFQKELVTIWSAPNYCYRCGNVAAVFEVNEDPDAGKEESNYLIYGPYPSLQRQKPDESDDNMVPDYFL